MPVSAPHDGRDAAAGVDLADYTTPIRSMRSRILFASLVALASSAGAQLAPRTAASSSAPDSIAARDSTCATMSFEASLDTPDCAWSSRTSPDMTRNKAMWARIGATLGVTGLAGALVGIHSSAAEIPRLGEFAGLEQFDLMFASALDGASDAPALSSAQLFRSAITDFAVWSWDGNQAQDGRAANSVGEQFPDNFSRVLQNIFVFALGNPGDDGVFRDAIFNGNMYAQRTIPIRYDSWNHAEDWRGGHGRQEMPTSGADMTATPEPATLALTASGLIALAGYVRRKGSRSGRVSEL